MSSSLTPGEKILGIIPTGYALMAIGGIFMLSNAFAIVLEPHSRWKFYYLWKSISSAAAIYAFVKKDEGHTKWFMYAMLLDIVVYLVRLPFDPEFTMTDQESCAILVQTHNDMTQEECLASVHEIRTIAYIIHVVTIAWKACCVLVAKGFLQVIQSLSNNTSTATTITKSTEPKSKGNKEKKLKAKLQ